MAIDRAEAPSREQIIKLMERVPSLSPMTTQLLAKLAGRDCAVGELAALVEKDALLSAQILKMANSAMYARLSTVVSVRHAITMVGTGTMRKFALGSTIANLFSRTKTAPSFSMTRFNLHSVATATFTELLCDELPIHNGEGAFVAGLLHDLGRLLMAVNLPKQFENVLYGQAVLDTPLWKCEQHMLGIDHAELSSIQIGRWALSKPIQWAVRYHHQPELAAAVEGTPPNKIPLSLALNKADAFMNFLGISQFPLKVAQQEPDLDFPGFSYSKDRVMARFQEQWKNLGDMFG